MKKYVGRPWSGWEDKFELDMTEVGCGQIGFSWLIIRT
jgi:hypothetical protein